MDSFPDSALAADPAPGTSPLTLARPAAAANRDRRRRDQRRASTRRSMQQLLMVAGFVVLYLFGLLVFEWRGLLAQSTLAAATLASGLVLSLFFVIFATGLNRRAADKRMTAAQALCGLAMLLGVSYAAPATHIMFGPYLFVTVAFGTYRLRTATMLLLVVAALAGFGAVIFAHSVELRDAALLQSELLDLLVVALALPGFLLLGARIRRMNAALFKAGVKLVTIKESARRDPLLGCYNRRYTTLALEQLKRAADETGADLCLALIDLDYFKRVNDEIGHLGGDQVLRSFAGVAQDNVRRGDVFGRYGGEEFLLILPDTELLTALNVAERIRAQVERHGWDQKLTHGVTVSIGVTQYIPGESALDLFSRADTAAYTAKRGGRNQVVVEEPPLP